MHTGYAFWESANTAVVSLTGAYVLEQLGMSAGDFIMIALLFVLCAIPGAITSIKIADKEWLSLKASVATWCAFVAARILHRRRRQTSLRRGPCVDLWLCLGNVPLYGAQRTRPA